MLEAKANDRRIIIIYIYLKINKSMFLPRWIFKTRLKPISYYPGDSLENDSLLLFFLLSLYVLMYIYIYIYFLVGIDWKSLFEMQQWLTSRPLRVGRYVTEWVIFLGWRAPLVRGLFLSVALVAFISLQSADLLLRQFINLECSGPY